MQSTVPLEVTYLRTTSLKPDPRNPRVHSDKQVRQIAQSIESFGFNVPLLIDEEQKVIAGHGRLLAARKLGWDTVPAIRLSQLTESQRMAFLIADNRLTENSSWDEQMLGEQLKILSELELDFDLEAIGFEVPKIDLLIDGLNTVPEADPDVRLPDVSESSTTVSGDLWQLGKHRVLCGNSLITPDYCRLMDGAKANLQGMSEKDGNALRPRRKQIELESGRPLAKELAYLTKFGNDLNGWDIPSAQSILGRLD